MRQHIKTFTVEIIKRGVLVFMGSWEQFRNYLKRYYPCYLTEVERMWDNAPPGSAYTFKVAGDAIIYADSVICGSTMVHEIAHATKHLLSLVEIEDEEAECYTLEYLYERIIPWLKTIRQKP